MFCPNCGTKNIENALFCCNCGIKLENFAPTPAPAVEPEETDTTEHTTEPEETTESQNAIQSEETAEAAE